jgi:hypothetical protein
MIGVKKVTHTVLHTVKLENVVAKILHKVLQAWIKD